MEQLEAKLGEKEQSLARISSVLSEDVAQLSLDMPDESAKGYTPGAKALLELPLCYETLHKKKKRSGGEIRVGSTAVVARPLVL